MPFCKTKTSNFLVTHYFYGGIVVCAYPIFCLLCSCSLLFFTAAHFHLAGRSLLAASISHFLTAALNFRVFFLQTSSLLFSITRSRSFSVIHVSVNIKTNVEKDTTLFLFFLSKSLGGNTISRQKRLELSVVLYLLIELFYIGMPVVRTDGRVYGHVITKISRLGRLPNFLIPGAPLRIKKWTYRFEVIWSCFVFCCLNLHIW